MTPPSSSVVTPPSPSQMEAQITRIQRQLERAGVASGEPLYDVLVSTTVLSRVIDRERKTFVADAKVLLEHLSKHTRAVDRFGERIEACAAQLEEATRTDAPSFLRRLGLLVAGVAFSSGCVALVIGGIGGYALGDRRAFGSQLKPAEQLRQTFGIDVLSAQTWAPLIERNDPRSFVQACITAGYRRQADGRRVCDVTLAFPPPEAP